MRLASSGPLRLALTTQPRVVSYPPPPTCLLLSPPSPSSWFQVTPPPLVEPLEVSSDPIGPAKEGDPAADDTAASRRSPCLEASPGFPPRLSSPPLQPVAVDPSAAGGGDTKGVGFGVLVLGVLTLEVLVLELLSVLVVVESRVLLLEVLRVRCSLCGSAPCTGSSSSHRCHFLSPWLEVLEPAP
ncbi:unnamed protein product [Closterium sp. NIES-53]